MFLDANIFLELQLAQEHAEACKRTLNRVLSGDIKATITDFHVDTVVIVMENYDKKWNDIALFLGSLLRYKGLNIYPLSITDRIKATDIMKDFGLDYDDALAVQAMKRSSIKTIVSYDEDFDSISHVKRVVPEELK